jgi:hypothetical protein
MWGDGKSNEYAEGGKILSIAIKFFFILRAVL